MYGTFIRYTVNVTPVIDMRRSQAHFEGFLIPNAVAVHAL